MSKAFTKEDGPEEALVVRPRAPLPDGVPNYVTARGLEQLRRELAALEEERAVAERTEDTARAAAVHARIADLAARVGSAVIPERPPPGADEVRFGATVTVRTDGGALRRYTIVGVDEANAREGLVAFVSPVARALLGRRLHETASVQTPRGEEEVEVVAVAYD